MEERECTACGTPIDDLEQGTEVEEAAYNAGVCLDDFNCTRCGEPLEDSDRYDGFKIAEGIIHANCVKEGEEIA
jgi:DNA-directed RNA polymerase subunit RPC12/RpoP